MADKKVIVAYFSVSGFCEGSQVRVLTEPEIKRAVRAGFMIKEYLDTVNYRPGPTTRRNQFINAPGKMFYHF